MIRKLSLTLSAAALVLAGCSRDGGGPLGFVMFDKNRHVAAAEPLFDFGEDRCFDSPVFLLSLFSGKPDPAIPDGPYTPTPRRATNARGSREDSADKQDVCLRLANWMKANLPFGSILSKDKEDHYTEAQRNEMLDALIAVSNRKCGRYVAFLQQYDANVNSSFGILAQATAIVASVTSGGTAQGFAAASGISGGARGTLNEAHFANQTVGVLANAFDNARNLQRTDITARQQCSPAKYTLMRGLEDVFRYHSSCSIVVGLRETQRAVEQARAPNLESFNAMVDKIAEAQQKMSRLNPRPPEGSGSGSGSGGADGAGKNEPGSGASPPPPAKGETPAPKGNSGQAGEPRAASAAATCPFDAPPATPAVEAKDGKTIVPKTPRARKPPAGKAAHPPAKRRPRS